MFCPAINKKCVGEQCRDWDNKAKDCIVRLGHRLQEEGLGKLLEQQAKLVEIEKSYAESIKLNALWGKLAISRLLSNPMVPDSDKKIIEQALQAPSPEVAQKLLEDAGLI